MSFLFDMEDANKEPNVLTEKAEQEILEALETFEQHGLLEAFLLEDDIEDDEEMEEVAEDDEENGVLTEAAKRRSKKSVLKQKVTTAALMIAKSSGDPKFEKMKEYRNRWKGLRSEIIDRYQSKATALVKSRK